MHASSRAGSVAALLSAALVGGAAAALGASCFIWLYETLLDLVWHDLPSAVGVDPFDSWWLFAVPALGGLLVGLGARFLGAYPAPMEQNIALWRSGGHVDPRKLPATATNSLTALAAGGPVGFEAALTGLLGGIATWISDRIGAAGTLVRQAWGAERIDTTDRLVRITPWLAAVSGLFAYHWIPFGHLDLGFRFDDMQGRIGIVEGFAALGFGALVAVPAAWALSVVILAEDAPLSRRSPVVAGVVGGLAFAAMALGSEYVLFSGQQGIQRLVDLGNDELLYLTVAKWAALVVALSTGWRGGPIFPMIFTAASLGVVVAGVVDVGPDIVMVAGVASVTLVIVKANIAVGFVLTLYAVPFSYAAVILVAFAGSGIALALARSLAWLPTPDAQRETILSPEGNPS